MPSVPHDQGCLSLGRTAASFGRICCRQNPSSNCGAGYSGVELACKLADRLGERGRFRLIELTDQILRTSPEFNLTAASKALEAFD